MPETASVVKGFEPILQAVARLQTMAVLAQAQQVEFVRLKELTGSSDSVMSEHLASLADAGFIKLTKASENGRQRTWAYMTRSGREAFENHVAALRSILDGSNDRS